MRRDDAQHCDERPQPAIGQYLAHVAPMALFELLGHGRFLPLLEVRQGAGTDEEHRQRHAPHPTTQAEDERADDERPQRARPRQRAAPVGQCGDDDTQGQALQQRENDVLRHETKVYPPTRLPACHREERMPRARRTPRKIGFLLCALGVLCVSSSSKP